MKKLIILILISLCLSSCINHESINVSFRKIYNSAIKKSGAIVESFGQAGSLALTYSDFKEDVLANFKPVNYYCMSDLSCLYHTRVSITGSSYSFDFLVKVNSQFQIDTSFGEKGYLHLSSTDLRMDNSLFDYYQLLGINSADNKFYVGIGNGIARFLPSGKLDTSFGERGLFTMSRVAYNYFPKKIIQSNLNELLVLTAVAPGGGSVSSGNFGSALISVSKSGGFKSIEDFNDTHLVSYRAYNNSFLQPLDVGEMLIVNNENYYAYMTGQNLIVKKTDLAGASIAGFNFPGAGYNTLSSDYRVKKLFDVGNEIYVFLSPSIQDTISAQLVVVDKGTGLINGTKSQSFTNGAQALVLDDVLKSPNGFVLTLKRCLGASCSRADRFAAHIDFDGIPVSLLPVATSNGNETDYVGQALSVLQKRGSDYYVLNFSPQLVGPIGESYTELSIKKFDEQLNIDNGFGNSGELITPLGYSFKGSFVNLTDKILLDDNINSYYLLNYDIGLKKVRSIVKLDKDIKLVTGFGTGGTIALSNIEVNSIELDEVNKHLYLIYTVDNPGAKEVYLRRYNMLTGAVDSSFGTGGDLFVYSANATVLNGLSLYYGKQVVKKMPIYKMQSFTLKNGFIFSVQDFVSNDELRIFKYNFSTQTLSNKTIGSADFVTTANFPIQEIASLYLTKEESLFVAARFNAGGGTYHNEFLKLSSSDFSVDTSFGVNGSMYIPSPGSTVNGLISQASGVMPLHVTDEYVYVMKQTLYVEGDGAGSFVKYQSTPGYQRFSYAGVPDLAFESAVSQQFALYETQFSGGHTNFKIIASAPASKSNNYLAILCLGMYGGTFQELLETSLDSINIKVIKLEFAEKETISSIISKAFTYLAFMTGEIEDDDFMIQESYSFDKGEYVYKIGVSSADNGQPVFKLFKLYN